MVRDMAGRGRGRSTGEPTRRDARVRWLRSLLLVALMLPAACGTRLDSEPTDATRPAASVGVPPAGESTRTSVGATSALPPTASAAGTQTPTAPPGELGREGKRQGVAQLQAGSATGRVGTDLISTTATCTSPLSPINIGSVGHYSGLAGAALINGIRSYQAWVQSVNAKGGLQCHPIKLIVVDDGADPTKNQTATRQLVERDGVVAMVFGAAPLAGFASVDYLTKQRVPTVGGDAEGPWFYDSPMFFPQTSAPDASWLAAYSALGSYAKSLGSKDVAIVYCFETELCAAPGNLAETIAPKVGINVAYKAQASIVQPDYTSVCLGAKKAGAPVFWYILDPNSGIRLARSCDSVGYHPKYFAIGVHTTPTMESIPAFNGLGSVSLVLPWMLTQNPSIAAYNTVMKQYGAGAAPDAIGALGWSAAMLLQEAVAHVQLGSEPTSQEILNGLWALNKNTLGGITYPLTFKEGETASQVACGWFAALKDGRWTSPNGTKPVICR